MGKFTRLHTGDLTVTPSSDVVLVTLVAEGHPNGWVLPNPITRKNWVYVEQIVLRAALPAYARAMCSREQWVIAR